MLLVSGAPCQLRSLAGQEHGRTIPLTDRMKALLLPGAVVLEKPYTLDQLLASLLEPGG